MGRVRRPTGETLADYVDSLRRNEVEIQRMRRRNGELFVALDNLYHGRAGSLDAAGVIIERARRG